MKKLGPFVEVLGISYFLLWQNSWEQRSTEGRAALSWLVVLRAIVHHWGAGNGKAWGKMAAPILSLGKRQRHECLCLPALPFLVLSSLSIPTYILRWAFLPQLHSGDSKSSPVDMKVSQRIPSGTIWVLFTSSSKFPFWLFSLWQMA